MMMLPQSSLTLWALSSFFLLIQAFVIYPEAEAFRLPPARSTTSPPFLYGPLITSSSTPSSKSKSKDDEEPPLPVVLWHGLGDAADNPGLRDVADLLDELHPGTYTHIVQIGDSGSSDRSASWFGNVTTQIEQVCEQLAADPILSMVPAVDAIGFSQGGQFLRGWIERCGHKGPRVRNLLTFGSQHNGIAEFQKCKGATDFVCHAANALLSGNRVWSDFVQGRLVPAQYYRPTQADEEEEEYEQYLLHSNLLADINSEREVKNATYRDNLSAISKFVMIVFEDDETVIPKESGWFAEVVTPLSSRSSARAHIEANGDDDNDDEPARNVTKLRDRPIYTQDWIGLKKLDEKGGLIFETVAGRHMELHENDLKRLFRTYLGPPSPQDMRATSIPQQQEQEIHLGFGWETDL